MEEGRIQLADQNDRFKYATDRSQSLVTVAVALVGFLAALLDGLLKLHVGIRQDLALAFWSLSLLLVLVGLAFGASVITTKAFLSQVDTTQVSSWAPPVLQQLVRDYAKAVRIGEITVADRVTIFRVATRTHCGEPLSALLRSRFQRNSQSMINDARELIPGTRRKRAADLVASVAGGLATDLEIENQITSRLMKFATWL